MKRKTKTDTFSTRALERGLLWAFAAGGLAIATAVVVRAVGYYVIVSKGPVTLTDLPTDGPQSAGFANATFDAVTVTVQDPSESLRALLAASNLTSALLAIAICLIVVWLSLQLLREQPFGRVATWSMGAVSVLVLLTGLAIPILNGLAAQEVAAQLNASQLPPFVVVLDPALLGWGLALAVVAGVFEIGQRMQRDTNGLV